MRNDAGTRCYGDAARRAACRKKRRARPSTPSTGSPGLCPGQTGQADSETRVGSNKDSAFALTLCSLLFACGILDSLI